jgi:putative protein-disulfide isomerase
MPELPRLYYFADPMCSWCYGFAPVMDKIRQAHGAHFDIRLVMGGLRPGKLAEPMTPARARVIRHHWREVAKMTGQPFEDDIFKRDDFVYDTEPAAKAVIVMERLAPAAAYEYYHEIQRGFYAHSQDITSPEILANFARRFDVSATDFATAFASEEAHKETWGQFTFSASLGVKGFPALVLEQDGQFMLLMRGWQPFEEVSAILERVLKSGNGESADGDSCEIGGAC